jgi:hypothetical protein
VDFTREPIIETVITPKEGCKLVVRSSKSNGQEEHFVDAVEVVSFGHSFFFRSLERPKTFLVPATDYEILEVREARMVLKNVGIDRAIKIGGGREAPMRAQREQREPHAEKTAAAESIAEEGVEQAVGEKAQEGRTDRKRERRRKYRSRRGREGGEEESEGAEGSAAPKAEGEEGRTEEPSETSPIVQQAMTTSILTSLLPPPPTLISETIARYKDNALFKDVFYSKEEPKESSERSQEPTIPLHQPEYGTFEITEEEEEEIYQQRKRQTKQHEEPIQNNNHEHKEPEGFPFDDANSTT